MAQKIMNEGQLREYVEQEVRTALMNEKIDEGLLSGLAGIAPIVRKVGGVKNLSMESIIGVILGQVAIAPLLTKLLATIGIPADSAFGKFIIQTAVSAGGAYLGDWIDKKWDPIGLNGENGNLSLGGGAGASGGGIGGGGR